MTLRRMMAQGAIWSLIEKAGNQGVSFLVFMVVARLIGPREYGLASLCFVGFFFANILLLGLAEGIVSLKIRDHARLSTIFWCAAGTGAVLTLACFVLAGYFADLIGEPRLRLLLQWFSLVFLCLGTLVVPSKIIYAQLGFKIIALRTLIGSAVSAFTGLMLAIEGYGAFAIVFQQISFYAVANCVVWSCTDWRPSFVFETSAVKHILGPGFKLMISDCAVFFEDQLPRIMVASILGPHALGYYAFGMRLRYALLDILINPPMSVVCPSLIRIKDDVEEQARLMGQIIGLTGFAIFPVLALAAATAPDYVPLLFGPSWAPVAPALQLFICGIAPSPLLAVIRESLRAHNKIGSYMKVQLPLVLLGLLLVVLLLPFGLVAVAAGSLVWAIVTVFTYLYCLRVWIRIDLSRDVLRLVWPLTAVAIMVASLTIYRESAFYPTGPWLALVTTLMLGTLVYVVAYSILQFATVQKICAALMEKWRHHRSLNAMRTVLEGLK